MHVRAVTLSRQCSHMVAVVKTTIEIDEDGEKENQMTDVQSDGKENAKIAMPDTEQGPEEILEVSDSDNDGNVDLKDNSGVDDGINKQSLGGSKSIDSRRLDQRDDEVLAGVKQNSGAAHNVCINKVKIIKKPSCHITMLMKLPASGDDE